MEMSEINCQDRESKIKESGVSIFPCKHYHGMVLALAFMLQHFPPHEKGEKDVV